MKYTLLLTFLILLSACAKQGAPTGGPKDTEPPKLVRAIPANESTLFTGRHIALYFDEFVQIKNNGQNVFSSPPLKLEFKVRKNQIHLEIMDSLLPNTTYTIQFSEQISDMNEGNPVKGLSYTFSTGKTLDSLKISGTVKNAFSGEPEPEVLIGIYRFLTDSFYLQKPDYLSFSSQNGVFTVPFLSSGQYRILAFKDLNKNFKYDRFREAMAYLSDTLKLNSDTSLAALPMSNEINPNPKISCTPYGPLAFLLTLERPKLPEENFLYDSQSLVKIDVSADSFIFYQVYDSISTSFGFLSFTKDTLDVICNRPNGKGVPLKIKSVRRNKTTAHIIFNSLIDSVLSDFLLINKDDTFSVYPSSVHYDTIFISDSILAHTFFTKWIIPEQSLMLSNNKTNEQALIYETTAPKIPSASVKILLIDSTYASNEKILILESHEKQIKKYLKGGQKELIIKPIAPGNYSLSVVIDKNGNKAWDAVSLILGMQPEPVLHFPEKILVKPGWVQESKISLDE